MAALLGAISLPLLYRRRHCHPPPLFASSTQVDPPPSSPSLQKLLVTGGRPLSGHVRISGSKNAALAVLAGTLCCSSGTSIVHGIPDVADTRAMVEILRSLGARVEVAAAGGGEGDEEDGMTVAVDARAVRSVEPCLSAVKGTRAGFFVIGPLVGRFGEAVVALPGGCRIGARPVDIHVGGLRALGAVVELTHDEVYVRAANGQGLVGGHFYLDYPSVGATETLMMAASVADGVTILSNAAREPEVVDVANFLISSGAHIEGVGTSTIVIVGKRWLHGAEFTVVPDRIEAGTFMVAAAITRSCLSMSPVIPGHLTSITGMLSSAGCRIIERSPCTLEISAKPTSGLLRSFHFKTCPYPGFPTDLQPQFMALLTTCSGLSIVEESVFESRMQHVKELQRLGARIQVSGSTALIDGNDQRCSLHGSPVVATDLRSGASLILAGLAAEGVTEIAGINHVDRGYQNLDKKLQSLGANIIRQVEFLSVGCDNCLIKSSQLKI